MLLCRSMIRSIHKDLGNQVDRYTIMARACIRGIHAGTQPEKKTLLYRITEWKELFMFNLNLTLLWLWVKLSSFFSSSTPMLPHPWMNWDSLKITTDVHEYHSRVHQLWQLCQYLLYFYWGCYDWFLTRFNKTIVRYLGNDIYKIFNNVQWNINW